MIGWHISAEPNTHHIIHVYLYLYIPKDRAHWQQTIIISYNTLSALYNVYNSPSTVVIMLHAIAIL